MVPAQPQACRRESLFPFQLLMIAEWLSSLPEPSTMQTLCTQNARTRPPTYSSSSVPFYIYPRPSIIIVLLFHVRFLGDTVSGWHYFKICSDFFFFFLIFAISMFHLQEKVQSTSRIPEMHSICSHSPLCYLHPFSWQLFGVLSWRMQCLPLLSTAPPEGCPSKRYWSSFSLSWICPASDWRSTHPKSLSSWWNWMNKG